MNTGFKNILFSIVIPTYNRADLIMETIESVLSQTYPNFEVIVVDNCSTDNTEAILKPLVFENKIKYIRNHRNYERAYSRNVGMANACGQYLTLLDSDDFMTSTSLADCVEYINNNTDIKVFHNLAQVVNGKKEIVYRINYSKLENQYKELCRGNFLGGIGCFMHKEIYSKYQFDEDSEMTGSEDYDFWFPIVAEYKVGRINLVNSLIREHQNRSVHSNMYNKLDYQRKKIIKKITENSIMFDKFGKYLDTLDSSFKMQILISENKMKFSKKLVSLFDIVMTDFSVLYKRRFYAVVKNVIFK